MDLKTSQTRVRNNHEEWLEWLTSERHISREVIKDAGLYLYREELSIPVYGEDDKLLFYKHRRSFKKSTGPKYRYDKGATSALFGAETLKKLGTEKRLIITEGELDALAIRSLGYGAVSSTGGAGTWRQEWSVALMRMCFEPPIILYDADKAGVEGALRVASQLPQALIAWTPVEYGKDPTDVIRSGHEDALLLAIKDAKTYQVPPAEGEGRLEALKALQKVLLEERKEKLANPMGTPFHVDIALKWVDIELEKELSLVSIPREKRTDLTNDIERARTYPIRELLKVNRMHKCVCPFHDDKEPSMHVYPDHAYCFVCGKRADAIDIYMVVNHCDFKTAVAALV